MSDKADRQATGALLAGVACVAILDCLILKDMADHTDYALYFLPVMLVTLFGLCIWTMTL